MDIGNISGLYSDIYKTNNQSTAKLENHLKGDMTKATDAELMDACKEFEAYFLEQMFKEMMKTVPESELSSGANTTLVNYYKDELVKDVAKQSVGQSNFGLAQTLYEQMKRNYEV